MAVAKNKMLPINKQDLDRFLKNLITNSLPMMNDSMQTPIRSIRRTPRQSGTPRQQNPDMLDVSQNRKFYAT